MKKAAGEMTPGGDGRGVGHCLKCLDVCVGGPKMHPLRKRPLVPKKDKPILKGSSAHFIPILSYNIKLKCIIHKGNSKPLTFLFSDGYAENVTPILSEIFSLSSLP